VTKQGWTGTWAYASPEHLRGQDEPGSDQFSLAVVLYQALAGRLPWRVRDKDKEDELVFMAEHIERLHGREYSKLRDLRPEVPEELEAVLTKALSADSKDRFESMQAFGSALTKFASPRSRPALVEALSAPHRPAAVVARPQTRVSRGRLRGAIAVAVVFAGGTFAGLSALSRRGEDRPARESVHSAELEKAAVSASPEMVPTSVVPAPAAAAPETTTSSPPVETPAPGAAPMAVEVPPSVEPGQVLGRDGVWRPVNAKEAQFLRELDKLGGGVQSLVPKTRKKPAEAAPAAGPARAGRRLESRGKPIQTPEGSWIVPLVVPK
jgi:serine/threonine protein kinase